MTKLTKAEKRLPKAEQKQLLRRYKRFDAEYARLVAADLEVGQRNLRRYNLCNMLIKPDAGFMRVVQARLAQSDANR